MSFVGTLLASEGEIGGNVTIKGYTNFPAFLKAIGVFIFLKSLNYEKLFGSRMERGAVGNFLLSAGMVWLMKKSRF